MKLRTQPVLTVEHLTKTFPGQVALWDVSLEVQPGEVHGLVGENGSGKSTLIKCLSGFHAPDAGAEIRVGGRRLSNPHSAAAARAAGMAFIHQDLGLIPSLSVTENFALGRGYKTRLGHQIRWKEEARRTAALLDAFGYPTIQPAKLVRQLSQAERTIVAIARVFQEDGPPVRLLALDEASSALPEAEVQRLFSAVRAAAARGVGVIYVSHRLEEVFELTKTVTVLRDGRKIGSFATADLNQAELIELIIGRPLESYYPSIERPDEDRRVLLKVQHLTGVRVRDVSFEMRTGEIVGVTGLLGSGRSELARLLFGAQVPVSGTVELLGEPVRITRPGDAIARGIAFVPEDRRTAGSFRQLTVGENLTLLDIRRFFRWAILRRRRLRALASELIERFRIKPPDADRHFYTLSGGNQQKVVLAKWLHRQPTLGILDEPVNGVDVGARAEIYRLIKAAAEAGSGILLISSEFEDICHLCNRVAVMQRGRIVAELEGERLTAEHIIEFSYSDKASTNSDKGVVAQ
jgi:ABC-type sugar transport system ATPase subunit